MQSLYYLSQNIKVGGFTCREAIQPLRFLPTFSVQVKTEGNEFTPLGANSFQQEVTSVLKVFINQGSEQEVITVVSLCKNGRRTWKLTQCEFIRDGLVEAVIVWSQHVKAVE